MYVGLDPGNKTDPSGVVKEFPWQEWSCNPPGNPFCGDLRRRQQLFEAHEGAKSALKEAKRELGLAERSANRHARSAALATFRRAFGDASISTTRRAGEIVDSAVSILTTPGLSYTVHEMPLAGGAIATADRVARKINLYPSFFQQSALESVGTVVHELHHLVTGSDHKLWNVGASARPLYDGFSADRSEMFKRWGSLDLLNTSAYAFECWVVETSSCSR